MSALTKNYVLSKTKKADLREVRNLNIWGSDIRDVSILAEMPNVEVLSLSVNSIESLADFGHCASLKELYLRKNKVSDLRQVMYLRPLKNLSVLWLCDNPIASDPCYKNYIIRALPQLKRLDDTDIYPEDAKAAASARLSTPLELPGPEAGPRQSAPDRRDEPPARPVERRGWDDATIGPGPAPSAPSAPPQAAPPAARQQAYDRPAYDRPAYDRQAAPRAPPAGGADYKPGRSRNVLLAVLNLLNELDYDSLETVKREASTLQKTVR